MKTMAQVCKQLGMPLAPEKSEGPCTCMKYLGIELDTIAVQLHLPREMKLDAAMHHTNGDHLAPKEEVQKARPMLTNWAIATY